MRTKTDFKPFKIGQVFNKLPGAPLNSKRVYKKVTIKYPSRLEAMAIDPSKIAKNNNLKYTPGQIDFTVKIFKTITVKVTNKKNSVEIAPASKRSSLIKHAVGIMRSAIGFQEGIFIDVNNEVCLRHCGLGSSSSLIAGVACAINELYGRPISNRLLVKYLAQNHGEEIDSEPDKINPVQCIGGSAACGTHEGGLIIIAGESVVVKTMVIPDTFEVVIGIPEGFSYPDSKYLMDRELENLSKFLECGQKFGQLIAYKLFHECFPDMEEGNLKAIGDLIYEYRYNMGSIKNCSFVYPPIVRIANKLSYLKNQNIADVLALSSVGPGMFAVTKKPVICEQAFKECKMITIRTKVHNGRYEVVSLN